MELWAPTPPSSLGLFRGTGETPSLQLLLEERWTPSESVVNRAELYATLHTSHEAMMPETGTNGAVGGPLREALPESTKTRPVPGLTKTRITVAPRQASAV